MTKPSDKEIDEELAYITNDVKKLKKTSDKISKIMRQQSIHYSDLIKQNFNPTELSNEKKDALALKVLKNLFQDPKWSFRKYTTIRSHLPDLNDEKVKELLRNAGSVKSPIPDMYGNELWKTPGPEKLAQL